MFVKQYQFLVESRMYHFVFLCLVPIVVALLLPPLPYNGPTITISVPGLGDMKGRVRRSTDNPSSICFQFLGIPYAEQPQRFTVAQPVRPWYYTRDCTKDGDICPQFLGEVEYPLQVSENCLVLSVSTPMNPNQVTALLPVAVWIHGGGFILGSSRESWYNPIKLVQEGTVIVQLNYRLGVLGFMTDGDIIPFNIGLKDIRCALEWVQQYIHYFGGDPNQVSIFGESAGSALVLTIWQSRRMVHLYHKVFAQSGTGISPWAVQKAPAKAFHQFLATTVCNYTLERTSAEQVQCLRSQPAALLSITSTVDVLVVDIVQIHIVDGILAAIVVEDPTDPDAIVLENPLEQLLTGRFRTDVPLMLSICSEEMLLFSPALDVLRLQSNEKLVPYGMMADDPYLVGSKIKKVYAGSEVQWTIGPKEKLVQYASDVLFNFPFRRMVDLIQPAMPTSIFIMEFTYASPMGRFNDGNSKVGHADDLFYTWIVEDISLESKLKILYPPETYHKRRQLNRLISNFFKFSHPTPTPDPLLNIYWPPVSNPIVCEFLSFGRDLTIQHRPRDQYYQFWFDMYNIHGHGLISL